MGLSSFLGAPSRGLQWLALTDTASVLTQTSTDDQGGGVTRTWAVQAGIPCRIDPLAAFSRTTGGAIDERSTHRVTTAPDVSVGVSDRVAILGRGTYEVTAIYERSGQMTQVFEVLRLQ